VKRDMDLVRAILLAVEARPTNSTEVSVSVPGRDDREVGEHLQLMEDAGLVEGVYISSGSAGCNRLTWHGYEFLESARNETVWKKAKDITVKKTGGLAMTAITEALKALVKGLVDGSSSLP
jgi:uncharacterized protein DUF2513